MEKAQALYHRNEFREARANASKDVEAYDEVLFALERMGSMLIGKAVSLGKYKNKIVELAEFSPLATELPTKHNEWHTRADRLYESIRISRNDAFHQGAFARHLTRHAIELALVLEDALTTIAEAKLVGDFMVRGPSCASLWQPLSFVRQQMLIGSFSYLPLWKDKQWCLISDTGVARYLANEPGQRKSRLADIVEEAIKQGLATEPTEVFRIDDPVENFLSSPATFPALVCRRDDKSDIIGIITAYDLL